MNTNHAKDLYENISQLKQEKEKQIVSRRVWMEEITEMLTFVAANDIIDSH